MALDLPDMTTVFLRSPAHREGPMMVRTHGVSEVLVSIVDELFAGQSPPPGVDPLVVLGYARTEVIGRSEVALGEGRAPALHFRWQREEESARPRRCCSPAPARPTASPCSRLEQEGPDYNGAALRAFASRVAPCPTEEGE